MKQNYISFLYQIIFKECIFIPTGRDMDLVENGGRGRQEIDESQGML